ncbi:hypothetical protein PMI15_03523 [Polaromonas sp. CF318]|uniref:hypothetical protein n=1 Tax=Polaromonas sp. CF318 TaxID=1144318 RepID=UPI0002714CA0|nr:hypothetical protein [Polaromonas sp. CF318]EJL81006.1 hypothetical protein PMI15_03523 [Polaromonas sp. CF318]
MLNKDPGHVAVKRELDLLAARFFRAVSFEPGEVPSYGDIHGLFIATGLLIKNTGATPEISSVAEFIAPRQALVDSGALTRFKEWELSEHTQMFGNIAHRYSAYGKAGTQDGKTFEARGVISTQFIKTPEGWKMSAMAWDDERPGLALPAELLGS